MCLAPRLLTSALLLGSVFPFAPSPLVGNQQQQKPQQQHTVEPLQPSVDSNDIGRGVVRAFVASVCIFSNVLTLPAEAYQEPTLRGVGAPPTVMLAAGGGGRAGSSSSAKKPSSSATAAKPSSKTPTPTSAVAAKAPPSVKTSASVAPTSTSAKPTATAATTTTASSAKPTTTDATSKAVASSAPTTNLATPAAERTSLPSSPAPTATTETKSLASSAAPAAPAPSAPQKEVVREVVREKTIIQEVQTPPPQQTIIVQQAAPVMAAPIVAAPDPGMAVLGLGLSAVNAIGEGMREARQENEIQQQKAELTKARVKEAELESRLRNLEYDQMARNYANVQAAQPAAPQ